jgi:RNA polymerase sigma-70 factor (ECF subfamily)
VATLDDELARHHTAAFGWALACCKWDRSAAGDVLHTAYLKIIDGRAVFAGSSGFRTFLFGVIRHTAAEERRRQSIRAMLPLSVLGLESTAPHVDAAGSNGIERAETSLALVSALRKLSRRQREVLTLVFYHDLTIAEAAQVAGISLGSARVHYERGKASLRRFLSGEDKR